MIGEDRISNFAAQHRARLEAAGFTEEPAPDLVLIRAERTPCQPEYVTELGMVRVKITYAHGGWTYQNVRPEDIIETRGATL